MDIYWRPWFGGVVEPWVRANYKIYAEHSGIQRTSANQTRAKEDYILSKRVVSKRKEDLAAIGKEFPSTFEMIAIPAGSFIMRPFPMMKRQRMMKKNVRGYFYKGLLDREVSMYTGAVELS